MADIEKVKTGIFEMLQRCSWDDIDKERHRFQSVLNGALELLKSQQAEIERMKCEGKSPTWKKGKAFCGNCGGCLENKEMFSSYHVSSIRFCKWCGVPVDWSNE